MRPQLVGLVIPQYAPAAAWILPAVRTRARGRTEIIESPNELTAQIRGTGARGPVRRDPARRATGKIESGNQPLRGGNLKIGIDIGGRNQVPTVEVFDTLSHQDGQTEKKAGPGREYRSFQKRTLKLRS